MKIYSKKTLILALASLGLLGGCGSDDNDMAEMNTAPMVEDLLLTTMTDTPVSDILMAMDKEGDMLSFTLAGAPSLGIAQVMADGQLTYTPSLETTGMDSFTVSVSDGVNPAVVATVNVTIEAQQLMFSSLSREAFMQDSQAEPLRLNGRMVELDVTSEDFYSDLLVEQ